MNAMRSVVLEVKSFTGHGFKTPEDATSILKLTDAQTIYLCKEAWDFKNVLDKFSAQGLSQGAILKYGKGKVAFFGEAAMFTARRLGKKKIGMNNKNAKGNLQLLLNTIHWLDHKME